MVIHNFLSESKNETLRKVCGGHGGMGQGSGHLVRYHLWPGSAGTFTGTCGLSRDQLSRYLFESQKLDHQHWEAED